MKYILILIIVSSLSCTKISKEKINYSTKSNKELILMLATIDKFGAGYSPNGHYDSFFILDHEMESGGETPFNVAHNFSTTHNKILKEIVVRGAKIAPDLVKNINNTTKSKLFFTIPQYFMGSIEYSDEYEPKDNSKIKDWPDGNSKEAKGIFTFSIGDFCFFALGQIVNRNFHPIRYQMTSCIVINSPIESKDLKNKIIKEWSNLNTFEHQKLLINDFNFFKGHRKNETQKRIIFYYPALAKKMKLESIEAVK